MDNEKKSGAAYIRVSTDKQEELSPDAQRRLLMEYAKKNNIFISEEYIFVENGVSGKFADKRPEFQRMIGMAKSNEHPFDVILVWKYSRFARNQEESIVYKSLLKKSNIEVMSISEPLIDGPFGTLIERIIEWMDEYYSIRLSGEVKRGMTENAMRGKLQARTPFGYLRENGKLIVDEWNRQNVIHIFESYVYQGKSFYGIAIELNNSGAISKNKNPFFGRAIRYILGNPIYCGYVMWGLPLEERSKRNRFQSEGVIIREGEHEPIISKDLFDKAQKRLKKEYSYKPYPTEFQIHWLSSMITCSACGSKMVSAGGNKPSFQCYKYKKHKCRESHFVRVEIIDKAVIKELQKVISSKKIEFTNICAVDSSSELKRLHDRLDKCDKKEERIKTAYMNGIDTLEEYQNNKEKIMNEKNDILNQINALNRLFADNDKEKMRENICNAYETIISPDFDISQKNAAIKSIVTKIVYDKKRERLDIYYFLS